MPTWRRSTGQSSGYDDGIAGACGVLEDPSDAASAGMQHALLFVVSL